MKKFAALSFIFALTVFSFGQSGRVQTYSESGSTGDKSDKYDKKTVAPTPTTVTDDDVIKVETDLVFVPTQINTRQGKTVGDIEKREFRIYEDGVEQEIAYFSAEEQPFTVALVLDMSYSSVFKLPEIQAAALTFINQLRGDDKVIVVSFDEKVRVLCEATNDRKILRLAVEGAQIASGTSLYSALDTVLQEKLNTVSGRKAIVLLSDGVDTESKKLTAADVLEKSAGTDVLVYPIQYDTYDDVQKSRKENAQVFYDDDDRPYTVMSPKVKGEREADYREADEFLKKASYQSGGKVYRVSSTTDLNRAFAKIAAELRQIYSLGYYPISERKNGAKYQIKVRVYRPNLTVRARNSYVWNQKTGTVR